ncbi:amidase signature enzyme [Rhizodiscina lignyota]|uniref:Amidase signature enzyme n=1 Tax=Rhizodiscina lignyota TaxID=1504668 RepID=A0A9P4M2V9_9PEZI|nr:amidase signature enzyme [Rhizodiscina lignyota]
MRKSWMRTRRRRGNRSVLAWLTRQPKDSINSKGIDRSSGFVSLADSPVKRDAEIVFVNILLSLGAVLYCKTSVAQASFAAEPENHIIGYIANAQNRFLSLGGSSGGEHHLIALRSSVVGFGRDIGGSIRHPAALNGLFGLKPSYQRLPFEHTSHVMEGQDFVPFSLGPLWSSAAGLTNVTKSVLGRDPWLTDPRVVEAP